MTSTSIPKILSYKNKLKLSNILHICTCACVCLYAHKDAHCNIILIAKIKEIIWMYTSKGFSKWITVYIYKMKYYADFKIIHYNYSYL